VDVYSFWERQIMRRFLFAVTLLLFFMTPQFLLADTTTITFDDLSDLDSVTNQYPGLEFTNAIALSSGLSLNEFEFPPHSGDNVISDDGGPISIIFSSPITSLSGYFTYLLPLTLTAFDAGGDQVDQVFSQFGSNVAMSGDLDSLPNELLSVSFAGGIKSVSIFGDELGGSFVLDDLSYSTAPSAVPEPSTLSLLFAGAVALFLSRTKLIR
jgi:hypothetical protein